MTCEIVIMNKQAAVLAADSSTTVTQWLDGKKEERYFKGTNKVFQLSNHHPIGMMIFDTAQLQGVPWDVVVKDFRDKLRRKSFNELEGYAKELFDYVKSHRQLFPPEFQKTSFLSDGGRAASLHYLFEVITKETVKNAETDEDRRAAIDKVLDDDIAKVDAEGLSSHFEQSDLDEALASHSQELAKMLSERLKDFDYAHLLDFEKLASLAVKFLFKRYRQYMDSTGIVLAGFGDNDYFPSFREYKCYGVLLGKFLFDEEDHRRVDRNTPAVIKPFATTTMVYTFVVGFSVDVFNTVRDETRKILRKLADAIASEKKVELGDDIESVIDSHLTQHTDEWTGSTASNHSWPLQRVIGSLPVDEMAELAETLVMLESLKEKVTQPTESVGGPIDVCVISKCDGFVWIKRKHYFERERNPQFFRRQADKFN